MSELIRTSLQFENQRSNNEKVFSVIDWVIGNVSLVELEEWKDVVGEISWFSCIDCSIVDVSIGIHSKFYIDYRIELSDIVEFAMH